MLSDKIMDVCADLVDKYGSPDVLAKLELQAEIAAMVVEASVPHVWETDANGDDSYTPEAQAVFNFYYDMAANLLDRFGCFPKE